MLAVIRSVSGKGVFSEAWFVAFAIVTLVAMNAGAFVLCFRRRKYVCLFTLCELASFVLFAHQIYELMDSDARNEIQKGSLKHVVLVCSILLLSRLFFFICQSLIIVFRLKYWLEFILIGLLLLCLLMSRTKIVEVGINQRNTALMERYSKHH